MFKILRHELKRLFLPSYRTTIRTWEEKRACFKKALKDKDLSTIQSLSSVFEPSLPFHLPYQHCRMWSCQDDKPLPENLSPIKDWVQEDAQNLEWLLTYVPNFKLVYEQNLNLPMVHRSLRMCAPLCLKKALENLPSSKKKENGYNRYQLAEWWMTWARAAQKYQEDPSKVSYSNQALEFTFDVLMNYSKSPEYALGLFGKESLIVLKKLSFIFDASMLELLRARILMVAERNELESAIPKRSTSLQPSKARL